MGVHIGASVRDKCPVRWRANSLGGIITVVLKV